MNSAYEAVGLTSARRAIMLVLKGKAESIKDTKRILRSQHLILNVPSIIRLRYYIRPIYKSTYPTKKNVFIRDGYRCQYCGSDRDLTVDHLLPRSRGGKDTWENMVCACKRCNSKKGKMTPEEANMRLISRPRRPSYLELVILSKRRIPEEWMDYLFFKR